MTIDLADPRQKLTGKELWRLLRDTVNGHAHCPACAIQAVTNVLADILASIPEEQLRDHDLATIVRDLPQIVADKIATQKKAAADTIGPVAGSA